MIKNMSNFIKDLLKVGQLEGGGGSGLKRLRDRLAVLYGGEGRLEFTTEAGAGFSASLVIPYVLADA